MQERSWVYTTVAFLLSHLLLILSVLSVLSVKFAGKQTKIKVETEAKELKKGN